VNTRTRGRVQAYPYISKRLLTDDSPRLRAALRYMIYGKSDVFDVERLIDLLQAFESFAEVRDSTVSELVHFPIVISSVYCRN
jgi:aarF domain-containing kinase